MNTSDIVTDAACARTASAIVGHPARRHKVNSPLHKAASACGIVQTHAASVRVAPTFIGVPVALTWPSPRLEFGPITL